MNKRILLLIALLGLFATQGVAQTPNMFRTGGTVSVGPFLSNYTLYRAQYLYPAAQLTGRQAGVIQKIYFRPSVSGSSTFTGMTIRLGMTNQTDFGTTNPGVHVTPVTTVYSGNLTLNYTAGNWVEVTLQNNFTYDGSRTLILDFDYTGFTGTGMNCFMTSASAPYYHIYSYNGGGTNLYPYIMDFGCFVTSGGAATKPVPLFYTPQSVCNGSPLKLINNSIVNGFNIVHQWTITPSTFTYMPGSNANSPSPWVIFNANNNYTVKLRVTNNIGADSITKTVTVGNASVAPISDFVALKRVVARASEITSFTNLSSNCPQINRWYSPDFANEFYYNPFLDSTVIDGQGFFPYSGLYDICLQETNTVGTSNICKSDYIRVLDAAALCTDTVSNADAGFITDDGGPGFNYGNNKSLCSTATCGANQCRGFRIDPCASSVTLTFDLIKFASGAGDSVIVHDGPSASSPRLIALGSGANGTSPTVTATSGKMFIYEITNGSGVDEGFRARWSSVKASYAKPTASFITPSVNGFGSDTFPSGYTIKMINQTTGVDAKYLWDVNGDNFYDSIVAAPSTILYNFTTFPERYTITMFAYNCIGMDTMKRTITILPVTTKPINLDFTASLLNPTTSDTVRFTETSIGTTNYEWTFTPSNLIYLDGTNRNSDRPVVKFQGRGLVSVKMKAWNSAGSDSITKFNYINVVNYCTPASAQPTLSDIGFNQVTLGSINSTSGTGGADYLNKYDSVGTSLFKGVNYSITVSRNTNALPQTRRAWIDFNIDGDFEDAGELVGSDVNSTNLSATYNFTVPANAKLGNTVLRVGSTYGNPSSAGNFLDPCATYLGEFEDYRIGLDKDNVKPVITLSGLDTVYVEKGSTFTEPGFTATDNLEGNITSKVVRTSNFDSSQTGYYYYWYNVADNYGNAAITKVRVVVVVLDNTPPTITLFGTNPMNIPVYSSFVDPGYSAFDNYSGNITPLVNVFGKVDTATVGTYPLLHEVIDYFGHQTVVTRIVNVIDNVKPVLTTLNSTNLYTHTVGDPFNDTLVVKATDNYYKNMNIVRTGALDVNVLGYDTVTYNVTDGSANAATPVTVIINIIDNRAPNINIATADTITIDVFTPFVAPASTVVDNYYTGLTATVTDLVNKNVLGTYTVTYTATDGSNNVATKVIYVKVVDRTSPVITLIGQPFVTWCIGKPYTEPGVQIVDNYYTQSTLQPLMTTTGKVIFDQIGTYCLKYQVTDPSGNISNEVERCINIEICAGLSDVNANNWVVYPNPSSGNITVKFGKPVGENVSVVVTNMMGAVISEINNVDAATQQLQLDLAGHAAGVYFVSVQGANVNQVQKINIVK